MPSAGTRPPGRTSTTSPTAQLVERHRSRCRRRRRPARPRRAAARPGPARAPWAWPMARISSQWPSSMIVTRVASSNQRSTSIQPISVATDAPNATSRPIEISSIIPGWRARSSSHAALEEHRAAVAGTRACRTAARSSACPGTAAPCSQASPGPWRCRRPPGPSARGYTQNFSPEHRRVVAVVGMAGVVGMAAVVGAGDRRRVRARARTSRPSHRVGPRLGVVCSISGPPSSHHIPHRGICKRHRSRDSHVQQRLRVVSRSDCTQTFRTTSRTMARCS